jgi:hypothetical protein
VPELALDDDQRHAFAGHLDGVRVAQLVRREAPPHARVPGDAAQLCAGRARPRPPAGGAVYDAEQRPDRQLDARLEPRCELVPGPVVHPHLATAAPLAAAHEQRPRARIQIGLGERKRLVNAQPGSPQHDDQAAQPATVDAIAGAAHHRNDLLDRGRIGRVAQTLVARRPTGVKLWHGGR